jgi:hypothetical protein
MDEPLGTRNRPHDLVSVTLHRAGEPKLDLLKADPMARYSLTGTDWTGKEESLSYFNIA